MKRLDLMGFRTGRLLVIGPAGTDEYGALLWECLCDCGKTVKYPGLNIKRKLNVSCGCYRAERNRQRLQNDPRLRYVKHGMHNEAVYRAYMNARGRCRRKNSKNWKDYGGRGIEFRFKNFEQWLAELGPRPAAGYTVDRIRNDGHYEPGNVRWATRKEQAQNQRPRTHRIAAEQRVLVWAVRFIQSAEHLAHLKQAVASLPVDVRIRYEAAA